MKKFEELYEEIMKKDAEKLIAQRKIIDGLIILLAVIGISLVGMCGLDFDKKGFAMNTTAIIFLLLFLFVIYIAKIYSEKYKEKVIGRFLENINRSFKIYPNKSMDKSEYEKSEFKMGNSFSSGDFIEGKLENNLKVQMADLSIVDRIETSTEKVNYKYIFKGLFVKVEFEKEIEKTIKLLGNEKKVGKNNLKIDNSEFEKHYDIYAENSIQAYQLFTPDIIEKILNFRNKTSLYPEIIVKEKYLYIRIADEKLFEPTWYNLGFDKQILEKYYDIIKLIDEISNHLLNTIMNEIL